MPSCRRNWKSIPTCTVHRISSFKGLSSRGGIEASRQFPDIDALDLQCPIAALKAYAFQVCGEAERRVVMRSPCASAALDRPLWIIVPNKALSL